MARSKLSRVMEIDPEDFEPEGSMFDDQPDAEQDEGNDEPEPE